MAGNKERRGGIIILEGGDCAGKTTLAQAIANEAMEEGNDFLYLHGSPWPGTVLQEHARMGNQAIDAVKRKAIVVMDHFWIAEQVYGAVYRDGPAYDPTVTAERMHGQGAVIVLCVPTDFEAQVKRHAERYKKGLEHFADAREVISRYIQECNEMAGCDNVHHYDMDEVALTDIGTVARNYIEEARLRREEMVR